MEICYSLTEDDLLNFQMYSAGESTAVKRRLMVGRFIVPVVCALLAGLFTLQGDDGGVALALLLLGVLFAVWMPSINKWQHQRHFKRHIREKCQGMLGAEASLRLEEGGMRSIAENSDGVIEYAGIESLGELDALFLIKLKQSLTILVPKERVRGDPVEAFIAALSEKAGLPVDDHRRKPWADPILKK